MIAFCTHCWAEIDSRDIRCVHCGVDLTNDPRPYEQKLAAALKHPLAEARARICWLLGENHIVSAVPQLIATAEHDEDLFVQQAAVEALVALRDNRALPLMRRLSQGDNHFLQSAARKALAVLDFPKDASL